MDNQTFAKTVLIPELVTEDSYTQRVGGYVSEQFELWICCLKLLKLNKKAVKLSVSKLWIIKGLLLRIALPSA